MYNDPWGTAMSAFFAVCDYLHTQGVVIPRGWGYRPGAAGPACEGYEYETLAELAPSIMDVLALGALLHNLTDYLDRNGRSY